MNRQAIIWTIGAILALSALAGCASTQPYVYSEVSLAVVPHASAHHQFTYVRAYREDGEIVVYGKVRHSHEFCEHEGHVDLALVDGAEQVVRAFSLPLRAQSSKRRGRVTAE